MLDSICANVTRRNCSCFTALAAWSLPLCASSLYFHCISVCRGCRSRCIRRKVGWTGCVEGVFIPGSLERFVFTARGIPFISIISKPSELKKKLEVWVNLLFPPDPLSQKKKKKKKKKKNNLYSHYQTKTSVAATSFKLGMSKIKLTETVLFVVYNHIGFGRK